jgi:hypothetical protein
VFARYHVRTENHLRFAALMLAHLLDVPPETAPSVEVRVER